MDDEQKQQFLMDLGFKPCERCGKLANMTTLKLVCIDCLTDVDTYRRVDAVVNKIFEHTKQLEKRQTELEMKARKVLDEKRRFNEIEGTQTFILDKNGKPRRFESRVYLENDKGEMVQVSPLEWYQKMKVHSRIIREHKPKNKRDDIETQ